MHKYARRTHKYLDSEWLRIVTFEERSTSVANTSERNITCSIVGARGYAGLETARLLLSHPHAELTHCFATSTFTLPFHHPKAAQVACLPETEILHHLTDVVFLATPAEVSLKLVPKLLAKGAKVIDLSGAFRLKSSDYSKWYGFKHEEAACLKEAVYGLAPFAGPATSERLIANPGCYATAIELALIPVLRAGLIRADSIVIDAKSGTSGAGKKATENLLFTEVEGDCLPYKVGQHQHYPEIVEACQAFAGVQIDAHMSTSLLPVRRGIIAGIYARLSAELATSPDLANAAVVKAFTTAFADYPLVSFGQATPTLTSLKRVVGTGRTHISYVIEGDKLYLFSAIDNLMKGAASQAIENFNRLTDQPLTMGLDQLEALT